MLFLLLIFTLRYHILKGSARKVSVLGLIILLTRWATMVTWWAQSSAVPYLWFKEKAIFIQLFIQLFRKARRWLPKALNILNCSYSMAKEYHNIQNYLSNRFFDLNQRKERGNSVSNLVLWYEIKPFWGAVKGLSRQNFSINLQV